MAYAEPGAHSAPKSEDRSLNLWRAQRDRLKAVLEDVAADRVSRDFGSAEIADLQQEIDRRDREIAAQQAELRL